ncbi:RDD family protein [Streptomyces griseus]|uniref:RDD family protein n=1 Tax=Streptomyces griseus TaxID=1911 RepID=UPI00056680AF|nr:RDD family protein [Streptomyces griseus]
MSAPTPAPGDDRPREGYYPDPSIPGYVRYWNGSAWVPGTSRPAPSDGEPLTPPSSVEETGPHFFDEDPEPAPAAGDEQQYGNRPEPASAWGAERSRQSGFGGEQDRRVSWGAPQGADPRVPSGTPSQPDGHSAHTDGTATIPPTGPEPSPGPGNPASGSTFVFRRPRNDTPPVPDDGTMTFRRQQSQQGPRGGGPGASQGAAAGFGTQGPVGMGAPGAGAGPGFGAGKAAAERAAQAQAAPHSTDIPNTPNTPNIPNSAGAPSVVPQQAAPAQVAASTPMAADVGGGQQSWAQQVHRLAEAGEDEQRVAPWKPPVEDMFQAAARRQAAARPAGMGKRLVARLIDTVVLAAVAAAAAVPLGVKALDHVNEKIDEAKLSGRTVTVWLLDGTTATYLGIVLAVLLVFGVLYEAVPTAKWGRTLGKKLLGLEVRDIEAHEPPTFGGALRRWLVYSVPGLLGIGVLGVLWCLFDRPWHQCWHDKAARTFVAGRV